MDAVVSARNNNKFPLRESPDSVGYSVIVHVENSSRSKSPSTVMNRICCRMNLGEEKM